MRYKVRLWRLRVALSFVSIASMGTVVAKGWSAAWTLSLPEESTRGYEYRGSCADPASGRLHLLLAPGSGSAPRDVMVARVSKDGQLEGVLPLGDSGLPDPLVDASLCAVLEDGAFMVVGSTRGRSLAAAIDRSGRWSAVSLGPGGYEAQVFDLALLADRRVAVVGSYQLRGFVVSFDPATGKAKRTEWSGRQGGSLVLDVEPARDGYLICGIEGPREEVLSPASEWFAAYFDGADVEQARTHRSGLSCRLLTPSPGGDEVEVVYATGPPTPALRRMRLSPKLETKGEGLVLDRIAFLMFLDSAQVGDVFATLTRSPASEVVEIFSRESGVRVESRRLGYFPIGSSDLVGAKEALVVVGRVLKEGSSETSIRVDALVPR